MMIKVVRKNKGEVRPGFLDSPDDVWPYYTLGIKWCVNPCEQWWGAYGTYSHKNQYVKAWCLLLFGIIANVRSPKLCEWAEPEELFSI